MSKKLGNEVKTGVLVVACLAVLLFMLFKMGALKFGETGYTISARFNFASGIEDSAPVMLAGVEVGEVRDISIQYGEQPKVVLTLWLKSDTQLREDSKAQINTMGLMGEKYVELSLGSSNLAQLKPGSMLEGEDPFQMDKLLKKSEVIAENLNQAITDVRGLATDAKSLVNNVNGVVTVNKDKIGNILTNLESTSKNFEEFSDDIKRHPWKLLMKGKEEEPKTDKKK